MSSIDYLGRPTNAVFHNFCKKTQIPPGTKSLLSKGLKFCPTRPRPTNNVNKTMKRFRRDIRRKAYHYYNPPRKKPGIHYIPSLYISKKWNAPEYYPWVEKCLDDFERHCRRHRLSYQKKLSLTNLTPREWAAAEALRENDNVIATETDKNCGGATLPRPVYIAAGVEEHLGNEEVYRRLDKVEAVLREKILRAKILKFMNDWNEDISPAESEFLDAAYKETRGRTAKFRMTPKVHKIPWKLRPIVCCCGTLLNHLSRWVDYWFQKLRHHIPSYIKDSSQLLSRLKELQVNGRLPPNIWVFTADARSMYTNIDSEHALEVIGKWLDKLHRDGLLPQNFPLAAVKEAMALVMQNNVFEWGDLYFLQLLGTAMGTSAACMWATIYFAVHENNTLLPRFSDQLLLYCRFIDDIFGIWIGNRNGMAWAQFKERCNDFGMLKWDFKEPSKSVDFLDLTIYIEDGWVLTKTYQKSMNLYQYISPSSNHPPKMIRGIVYSLLRTYKLQNIKEKDYLDVARLMHERHVARGWGREEFKRLIIEADFKLRQDPPSLPPSVTPPPPDPESVQTSTDRVFMHIEYGRNDLPRKAVRAIYNSTCREMCEGIGIKHFTVAYSRPKNIKDLVTKAKLHMAPGKEASKYYLGELSAERER